jgi:replicative DNA helicase
MSDAQTDHIEEIADAMREYELELELRHNNTIKGIFNGIDTGLKGLNNMVGGWQKGNLIIIAARPSMGKTAIALLAARQAAKTGKNILFQSLEMTKSELIQRIILSETGIDVIRLKSGLLTENDKDEFSEFKRNIKNWGLCIDDSSSASFNHIKMSYRKQARKRKKDFDMMIVDYLGLMDSDSGDAGENEALRLGRITKKLKQFAKKEQIPVILLVQLNRDVEKRGGNKRPFLSDLKQSGSIEEDADVVILLYRPEYYGMIKDADGVDLRGRGEAIVSKNRNGAVGSTFFQYDKEIRYITSYEEEDIKYRDFSEKIIDNPF